jgi:oxygen-independent coproporphyrinogen-3 oxidase
MAGIYIHIPFCKKLCFYCDFYHLITPADNSGFINALLQEITIRRDYLGSDSIKTIYFGGGTPSIFSVRDLDRILDSISREFTIETANEFTIEVNPDDVTEGYMKDLRHIGFNRVSMGIQSWRDEDLKFLNRRHDSAGARSALTATLSAGFENISIDLIYGIPGMTPAAWESNLDITFGFDAKHLSAYHLTIEPGTVFGKMLEKGVISEIDEEESNLLFNMLINKSEQEGFLHYEISNFGKPGYFSEHNSNYWKQVKYLGLGPSAHSFNGYSRQWNKNDLKGYIKAISNGEPDYESEEIDSSKKFNEYIMTSLRTMWGIDLNYIESSFDKESYDYVRNLSLKFREYGLMKLEDNHLILSNQGKMISDNIISEFMMPAD